MPVEQIEMLWHCGTCANRNRGRHMECQSCGKPKGDEEYVMPDDIEAAPAIMDSALLRQATAGANWRCIFCRSEQRRLDGLCGQCGSDQITSIDARIEQCPRDFDEHFRRLPLRGASPIDKAFDAVFLPLLKADRPPNERLVAESDPFPTAGTSPYRAPAFRTVEPEVRAVAESIPPSSTDFDDVPPTGTPRRPLPWNKIFVAGVIAAAIALLFYAFWPRTVHTAVESVAWTQAVTIERYSVHHQSGFSEDRPGDAFNVRDVGTRYHHSDHVLDHYETVHYSVQEACGQTCTPIPRTCSTTPRSCTSNKNGYATCTGGDTVCTGGGQSCSTKYCTVNKTRQEPRYVDIPRYHAYYEWDAWRWAAARTAQVSGTSTETRWPGAEQTNLCGGPDRPKCHDREDERTAAPRGTYAVRFANEDHTTYSPSTENDFHRFKVGSHWMLKVDRLGIVHDLQPE